MGDKINCLTAFYLLFSRVRMTKIPTLYFPNFFYIGASEKHWKPSWKSIATNTKKKKKSHQAIIWLFYIDQNYISSINLHAQTWFLERTLRFGMSNLNHKVFFHCMAKAMQINVFQWVHKKVISLYFVFKPPMFIDFILDKLNKTKIKWLLKGHIWNWSAKN